MGGFRTFVSEVKGDHFRRNICFQQSHRCRMSKRMWGDVPFLERRQWSGGTLDELLELVSSPRAAEPLAEAVGQQRSLRGTAIILKPPTQSPLGLRPQRNAPLLASFARQFDLPMIDVHIPYPERKDLRDAGAGVVQK